MSFEPTYLHDLGDDEPNEPTEAWIETASGLRVDCTLTRKDRLRWEAAPPAPYRLEPGDQLRIDRLPAGGTLDFTNVLPPEAPPAA